LTSFRNPFPKHTATGPPQANRTADQPDAKLNRRHQLSGRLPQRLALNPRTTTSATCSRKQSPNLAPGSAPPGRIPPAPTDPTLSCRPKPPPGEIANTARLVPPSPGPEHGPVTHPPLFPYPALSPAGHHFPMVLRIPASNTAAPDIIALPDLADKAGQRRLREPLNRHDPPPDGPQTKFP